MSFVCGCVNVDERDVCHDDARFVTWTDMLSVCTVTAYVCVQCQNWTVGSKLMEMYILQP
jgi:hypothetical protein